MTEGEPETPRKRRRAGFDGNYADLEGQSPDRMPIDEDSEEDLVIEGEDLEDSPSKRRGQTGKSRGAKASNGTPRVSGTPRKQVARTPGSVDRSARKRATRVLVNKLLDGDDDVLDEEDEILAEKIIRESKQEVESPVKLISYGPQVALFLDGSEGYFDQHKMREKISTTPFSNTPGIEYRDFVQLVRESRSIHEDARGYLASLYRTMFPQWKFELSQGFNLLFYGIGSKRNLIMEFVNESIDTGLPVLVVNGYNTATTFKEVLNSAVSVLVPDEQTRNSFPRAPNELIISLLDYLESSQNKEPQLVIVVHNIDGVALRSDKSQALLARLASAQQVSLIASVDHINAPILWDAAKLSQYNFLWHDMATFELYTTETSFEDPFSLGKNRSAVGARGVKYVLASLTANARSLYRVLVCHQLEVMNEELQAGDKATLGTVNHGIEFNLLFKKCMEEFIVSGEVNFRTMLVEFIEHKMAVTTKNQAGVEMIYIPFTKDSLDNTLEELMEM